MFKNKCFWIFLIGALKMWIELSMCKLNTLSLNVRLQNCYNFTVLYLEWMISISNQERENVSKRKWSSSILHILLEIVHSLLQVMSSKPEAMRTNSWTIDIIIYHKLDLKHMRYKINLKIFSHNYNCLGF